MAKLRRRGSENRVMGGVENRTHFAGCGRKSGKPVERDWQLFESGTVFCDLGWRFLALLRASRSAKGGWGWGGKM